MEELLNGNKVFDEIIRINNPSDVSNLPYFQDGYWWVQGLAATLPVIVINEIYKNSEKKKINVLDVGASPGGKSFQLLDLGFSVQSIEISNIRIRKFIKNSNRLRYKNEIIKKIFLILNLTKNLIVFLSMHLVSLRFNSKKARNACYHERYKKLTNQTRRDVN